MVKLLITELIKILLMATVSSRMGVYVQVFIFRFEQGFATHPLLDGVDKISI